MYTSKVLDSFNEKQLNDIFNKLFSNKIVTILKINKDGYFYNVDLELKSTTTEATRKVRVDMSDYIIFLQPFDKHDDKPNIPGKFYYGFNTDLIEKYEILVAKELQKINPLMAKKYKREIDYDKISKENYNSDMLK